MCDIAPFRALRPLQERAAAVAAPPYDVMNTEEARRMAAGNPFSFLHVTRSEIDLPANIHPYSTLVYEKAAENIHTLIHQGTLLRDPNPCYYIYRLTMDGRPQTGLVCLSSVRDYEQGVIKKHEFTRPEKEQDRIRHISTTGAQTGNVFLAYPAHLALNTLIEKIVQTERSVYDFTAADDIRHEVWVVADKEIVARITQCFREDIPSTYIADGHHRAASAAKVKESFGSEAPTGSDWFLTSLFPSDQLQIMDYNRLVRDLHGHTPESLLQALEAAFTIQQSPAPVKPSQPHQFGMYLDSQWYVLNAQPGIVPNDPVGILDVSVLSRHILERWLGIHDQRTDKRIDFVGGIRGLMELQARVDSGEMAIAFSLHPVSIQQLFAIADTGDVMPPKSTWFEPKLRDGLLTHLIRE
ncbi:MAG: DUF1015 domain-containing protein [Bacteroidetes bacterium]|nr:DUF1015 domain-containing protein [Bacteroidota bacterium]